MKKIMSKEEKERIQKRNQWIIGGILIFIMVGSGFGIMVNSFGKGANSRKTFNYNGVEFFQNNGFWVANVSNKYFVFRYFPNETGFNEKIIGLKPLEDYASRPLYVYSESVEAKSVIYLNMNKIALRMQDACPINQTCGESVPTKDCSNNFIIIKENNQTTISQNNSCVIITAPKNKLVETSEEFIYQLLGVK